MKNGFGRTARRANFQSYTSVAVQRRHRFLSLLANVHHESIHERILYRHMYAYDVHVSMMPVGVPCPPSPTKTGARQQTPGTPETPCQGKFKGKRARTHSQMLRTLADGRTKQRKKTRAFFSVLLISGSDTRPSPINSVPGKTHTATQAHCGICKTVPARTYGEPATHTAQQRNTKQTRTTHRERRRHCA